MAQSSIGNDVWGSLPSKPSETPEQRKERASAASSETSTQRGRADLTLIRPLAEEELRGKKDTNIQRLANDFTSNPAYKRFDSAIVGVADAFRTGNDPTGDIALTYAAAKVFDPDSAVRDAEQAALGNTTNFIGRAVARIKKEFGLPEGGTFTPEARERLRREVYTKGVVLSQSYDRLRNDYMKKAEARGYNPEDIVGTHLSAPFRPDIEAFEKRYFGQQKQEQQAEAQPGVPATPIGLPVAGEGYVPPSATAGEGAKTSSIDIPVEAQQEVLAYINKQRAAGKPVTEEGFIEAANAALKKYGVNGRVDPEAARRSVEGINKGSGFGGLAPAEKKLSFGEGVANDLLTNPITGTALGGVYGASAGLIPEAVGLVSPEAQAKMERSVSDTRTENLGFALGEAAGSGLSAAKLGGLLAPALRTAGYGEAVAPALGNVAFGTTQGAAEAPEGQRLKGATTGFGLSLAGEGVPYSVSKMLKPTPSEEVTFLRSKGIQLTPGTTLGGRAARLEEALAQASLGGGDIALAARRKAFDDFARQYLNEGGKHIGFQLPNVKMKPTERMKQMREAFDNAYENARNQMNFVPDQQMSTDLADFQQKLASDLYEPSNARRLNKLLNNEVLRRVTSPSASGDDYKKLSALLRNRREAFSKQQNWDMVNGVDDLQAMIDNAARRNSPPEAVAAMDAADKGYAFFARAQEAGRMAGSKPGMFTPTQLMSVERRGDTTVRGRAFNEGDTLAHQWAESGQSVLGEVEPNSGTANRLFWAGAVSPVMLAPNVALGLSNAPGIKQGITALMAGKRPEPLDTLGGLMQKYQPQIGGATSAGAREGAMYAQSEKENARVPVRVEQNVAAGMPGTALADLYRKYPELFAPSEETEVDRLRREYGLVG